jgi:hypothetical protein
MALEILKINHRDSKMKPGPVQKLKTVRRDMN